MPTLADVFERILPPEEVTARNVDMAMRLLFGNPPGSPGEPHPGLLEFTPLGAMAFVPRRGVTPSVSPYKLKATNTRPVMPEELPRWNALRGISANIDDAEGRRISYIDMLPMHEQFTLGPDFADWRNTPKVEVTNLRSFGAKQGLGARIGQEGRTIRNVDERRFTMSREQHEEIGGLLREFLKKLGVDEVQFMPLWQHSDVARNRTDAQSVRSRLYGRMLGGTPEDLVMPADMTPDTRTSVRIRIGDKPNIPENKAPNRLDSRQLDLLFGRD